MEAEKNFDHKEVEWKKWIIKFLVNSNMYLPSPVVAVYEKNDKLFIRYPSGKSIEANEEEVATMTPEKDNVIYINWSKELEVDEYVFVVSPNDIIIWSHAHIIAELNKRKLWNILSESEEKFICDYINNTSK